MMVPPGEVPPASYLLTSGLRVFLDDDWPSKRHESLPAPCYKAPPPLYPLPVGVTFVVEEFHRSPAPLAAVRALSNSFLVFMATSSWRMSNKALHIAWNKDATTVHAFVGTFFFLWVIWTHIIPTFLASTNASQTLQSAIM